jgi:hypothetical protein
MLINLPFVVLHAVVGLVAGEKSFTWSRGSWLVVLLEVTLKVEKSTTGVGYWR